MSDALLSRFQSPSPKRILALDGGGIRGAISIGFLKRIEDILRKRHNNPDLLLCDYFDLIGGTSTGSIIATLLALGKTAGEIEKLYLELGQDIFGQKNQLWNPLEWDDWLSADFDARPLEDKLGKLMGDHTLGSDALHTGLCIVAKRADTFSTWPMHNNPRGPYYGEPYNNRNYKLRDMIRASTAAPSYFKPQEIDLGDQKAVFIDGGVSMANNPAWQLFLLATLKGYGFNWKPGERKLLLVSVGTGTFTKKRNPDMVKKFSKLGWAKEIPDLFMEDASWQNQTILQYLSKSPTRYIIDGEIGDMKDDILGGKPQLHYLRYNAWLEKPKPGDARPKPELEPFTLADLEDMREMSNAKRVKDLTQVGQLSADFYVQDEHFPEWFDQKKLKKGE